MTTNITKEDITNDPLVKELEQMSGPEATAMEALLHGATITAAARAAGVDRGTIYNWLKPGSRFAQAYDAWKRSAAESARTQLLMLAENATSVLATALKNGDTKTAVKLLSGLGILSPGRMGHQ